MTAPLLLFDIDGTLLRSGGAGMRAMRRAVSQLYRDDVDWDGIETRGSLDPVIFAEMAARNGHPHDAAGHERFRLHYVAALAEELDRGRDGVLLLPGVSALLATLRPRAARGDMVLGLLTGNYRDAVPLKLRAVGLDPGWFAIQACGDDAPTRPDLTALAMRRCARLTGSPPDPGRVIVIGDTPLDVACAHAHGCVALAVTTGWHDAATLRAAGADLVMTDLSDPTPLLELMEG